MVRERRRAKEGSNTRHAAGAAATTATGHGSTSTADTDTGGERRRYRLCLVSDFFHPNMGGVESHIFQLAQGLLARGHKVVAVTHAYGDRAGVRYLTAGLKVYYLPFRAFYNQCVLPTLVTAIPLLRQVFVRERITIVHGHSAFSTLGHEALMLARTMGLKGVFTDHSLFGFADASSIITNKVLEFSLCDMHHVICVSHTSKENTVLRAGIAPETVSVIPNAVDSAAFTPSLKPWRGPTITIVVVSRLVLRKGMDLLAGVLPIVCRRHPNVRFLIAGDGPKRTLLEQVRETHELYDQVEMLGTVPHTCVRDTLVRGLLGQIFLNCSLTEAFCIAILEAASCGLTVVSTRVGGVPEVLPPDMIMLADPSVQGLVAGIEDALLCFQETDAQQQHERVRSMYSWRSVAERTEQVYDLVDALPVLDLRDRLILYYNCGPVAGKIFMCLAVIVHWVVLLAAWLWPACDIDVADDW